MASGTATRWFDTDEPGAYRFSVDQYHRMIATGVFKEHDRVMLIEGRIVTKMTHNPLHDETVWRVQTRFLSLAPDGWIVRVQSAITTADSEPEPDVVIAKRQPRGYINSHPRSKDIALVVEVSDSTLAMDRKEQGRIYARARITVNWIVNLADRHVEVYTRPRGGRLPAYRRRQDYVAGNSVPLTVAGVEVAQISVGELLPD
jgi:hypothetical protein